LEELGKLKKELKGAQDAQEQERIRAMIEEIQTRLEALNQKAN
jgi:hypothetical protein